MYLKIINLLRKFMTLLSLRRGWQKMWSLSAGVTHRNSLVNICSILHYTIYLPGGGIPLQANNHLEVFHEWPPDHQAS